MTFQDVQGVKRTLQGVNVELPQGPAITIAPPLRGGRYWLVSEGSGNSHSHHWGSLLALNGVVTTPQRYAVDYVGLNGRGHALEIAPTVFAYYAHLRPGSLRVHAGQHVHRGKVLAHLGDSGN